ncbi:MULTISPECIES: dUTP diphosphatase [unclassified Clostridium]|uniref:dUTP diphosphatase n=1 Tax=unclassified Clostridium TaxID=2614128 RepID=UPI0029082649|nr:dUTP diphosphatase [Clostridium sp.]MDU5107424.1 dUTP diphosphatase [Clostridium sp.]
MEIKSFFEAQIERNKQLVIDSNLSEYKIWARKYLELHTKISHLADETQCYKYWIGEELEINKEALFKKYLDCFATIISIGIDKKYNSIEEVSIKPNDYCLSDQFLNLFIDLNDLIISTSEDHYLTLVEDFISLGITLGYSETQIREAFLKN